MEWKIYAQCRATRNTKLNRVKITVVMGFVRTVIDAALCMKMMLTKWLELDQPLSHLLEVLQFLLHPLLILLALATSMESKMAMVLIPRAKIVPVLSLSIHFTPLPPVYQKKKQTKN
eukprot:TRINITY_DN885_c0_g1_i18.p2 TRINITY_DN885_c0_g1~~TRINITY_DN885_c0_g1_i18.p2  ORF type:complete len:117 (+),score=7.48 TRINITY_DN885_c0_g1_i18:128-478(+)